MLASNAQLRVGLWWFRGLCDFFFFSLTCLLTYHIFPLLFALGSCSSQLFCQENLCFGSEGCFGSKNLVQRPADCSGFRQYCSECERVCMWKCTLARLAVWEVLISGVNIGLLSTLRKLGSPEGSFCCINSECYFQFDPNTQPPPPPTFCFFTLPLSFSLCFLTFCLLSFLPTVLVALCEDVHRWSQLIDSADNPSA